MRRPLLPYAVLALILSISLTFYISHHKPSASATTTLPSTTQSSFTLGISRDHSNLLLGNPSAATHDPANTTNYLLIKPYYTLSYNNSLGTPNWVSWRVTRADLGDAPRKQLFDTDTTLPDHFVHVTHKDYTGSGFDRGHMCPHSDRAANKELSYSTFIMTNIVPQAPNLNQKAWAELEEYCRTLVRDHACHLYILAGPIGKGGTGSAGAKTTLSNNRVTVPAECWKIVVIVSDSPVSDELAEITAGTSVLAVIMPNENSVTHEWKQYRTTVGEIERRTGLRFFTNLPPGVAAALREKS